MPLAETFDNLKKWCLGTRNLAEAEEGIRRDSALQAGLKTWSKRLGKAALVMGGLVVVTRAGFMLVPALTVTAAYGAVKIASYLVDRDIRSKREAEERMKAAEDSVQNAPRPSRQPGPKLAAKATGAFNAGVASQAAPPAETPAKPPSFLKRLGLGG